jgi:hypothetical protein
MKNENKPEKDMRDASHFEILSNVPGKEQDGIDMPILKLWGEVENFYGDPHKNETGRQLLLRIQSEYNISFKPESKEVESVPVKSAEEIAEKAYPFRIGKGPDNESLNNMIIQLRKGFISGYQHPNSNASQFKTNPIEVIKKEINEQQLLIDKYREEKWPLMENHHKGLLNKLSDILKIIQ